ncbi:MAG: FAD-dependent oxidoreductase, partial [Solirubrobacterales bacterium]|nr:FAD-dependent oxidoreductase [Solirubrobacterales bacterium]
MSHLATITQRPSHYAAALHGKIVLPEHGAYDVSRRAWNLAVDQRPAAIVFAETTEDVVSAILFAAQHGQRIAPQGTGHNADPLGPLEDTILLKTERMREITIEPVTRTARVEAGAVWLDVVEAAAKHGMATLAGSSPDVGVIGYALGGGVSFLGRRYGLASNHVRAIELVTADGQQLRVDAEHQSEMFWALRGGGGSFGVVTAIELQLFPITHAYAGHLWYPIERGCEVLHAWRQLTAGRDLPDELTTVGRFLNLPPAPEIPDPIRGQSFVIVEAYHIGNPAQADELLAPLRRLGPINDTMAKVPMPALSHLHMDPPHPVPGAGDGMMLAELPSDAVNRFVQTAGEQAAFPLLSVELRHLEGELGRRRLDGGALSSIDAAYALYAVGMAPIPEMALAARAQITALKQAMAPWKAPHMYLNFAETSIDPASLWDTDAYDRL